MDLTGSVNLVYNINMVHIAPIGCVGGLMEGSSRVLKPGGVLLMYGPYLVDNKPTTQSNDDFDKSLKSRNPEWGLRDCDYVRGEAEKFGMKFCERIDMPFNNFIILFQKEE